MGKGVIVVFSNPTSAEKEDEYNEWYSGIHIDELSQPAGCKLVRRFKLADAQVPGAEPPPHKYIAIYELDEMEKDFPAMAEIKTTPSDAIDVANSKIVLYDEIYEFRK
jgi:hypothetical protein